jgi:hypothetical protein
LILETAGLNAAEFSANCRELALYAQKGECWQQASKNGHEMPIHTLNIAEGS